MICKKFVLPESKPDIVLNADGICNVVWHQSSFASNLIANEIYNRIRANGK